MTRAQFTERMRTEAANVGEVLEDFTRIRKHRDGFRCIFFRPAGQPTITVEWTSRCPTHLICYAQVTTGLHAKDVPVARIPV